MEEEQPQKHQRGKSPQPRLNHAIPVQTRANKAAPRAPVRQAVISQMPSSSPQQARVSGGAATITAASKVESDEGVDDWSDISELQEIDPRQLQSHKDQNGNVDKGKGKLSFQCNYTFKYIPSIYSIIVFQFVLMK